MFSSDLCLNNNLFMFINKVPCMNARLPSIHSVENITLKFSNIQENVLHKQKDMTALFHSFTAAIKTLKFQNMKNFTDTQFVSEKELTI